MSANARIRHSIAAVVLSWCIAAALPVLADDATMNAEIDFLLEAVAESSCVFVRNGKEHAAPDAKKHLQTKRKRGRKYFDTAEEFIDRLASRSSFSGKDYMIRCGDETSTAGAWFSSALARYRSESTQR